MSTSRTKRATRASATDSTGMRTVVSGGPIVHGTVSAAEAGDGEVAPRAQVEAAGDVDHQDGQQVVRSDDGRGPAHPSQEPLDAGPEGVVVAQHDRGRGQAAAVVSQPRAHPGEPLDLPVVGAGVAHVGDPLVAAPHEVVHERRHGAGVVDVDAALRQVLCRPAERHVRDAEVGQDARARIAGRGVEQREPVDTPPEHEVGEAVRRVVRDRGRAPPGAPPAWRPAGGPRRSPRSRGCGRRAGRRSCRGRSAASAPSADSAPPGRGGSRGSTTAVSTRPFVASV